MGLLVFSHRRQNIIVQKANLNKKLLDLRQKQYDLQNYASSIADGAVSFNDLMGAPPTMFGRMVGFMSASHQQALMGAQMGMPGMLAMAAGNGIFNNLDAQTQQQYQYMMFKNLYDKEREKFSRQEEKILHTEDKRIEQQVAQLNTQLQMLEAEEKNVEKAEDEEAKRSVPRFGLA